MFVGVPPIIELFLLCTAITYFHKVKHLNNSSFFLITLEVRKSKVKVLANMDAGKANILTEMDVFFLYLHMAERERELCFFISL